MSELLTSESYRLQRLQAPNFREQILVSATDARGSNLSDAGQFCIFAIEPSFPGPPPEEYAVHVSIDRELSSGSVLINTHFLDHIGLRLDDDRLWSLKRADAVVPVSEALIEMVVEQNNLRREIDVLRRERDAFFVNRCLLIDLNQSTSDITLPVLGRGYFNFRDIQPAPSTFRSKTILVLNENTTLNLFVPHRKSGVDMVIVVDASNSMELCDYVGIDGRPHPRMDGVKSALDVLLQRRLSAGSRVSRIAVIVFGAGTRMLYPLNDTSMVELKNEAQVDELRTSTRYLGPAGLDRLKVDRTKTNISAALQYAAELLDYYAQAGNEKMMVLLSDGADWKEDSTGSREGEVVSTSQDPAVLADSLHFDSQVRIHTVAISNDQALHQYEDRKYWSQSWAIPNTNLLRKIADFTDGLFFESPDGRVLTKLLDEIGEGALYPI